MTIGLWGRWRGNQHSYIIFVILGTNSGENLVSLNHSRPLEWSSMGRDGHGYGHLCLLEVSVIGRNQYDFITPTLSRLHIALA